MSVARTVELDAETALALTAAQQALEAVQRRAKIDAMRATVAEYDALVALDAVLAPLAAAHGITKTDQLTVDGTTLTITTE